MIPETSTWSSTFRTTWSCGLGSLRIRRVGGPSASTGCPPRSSTRTETPWSSSTQKAARKRGQTSLIGTATARKPETSQPGLRWHGLWLYDSQTRVAFPPIPVTRVPLLRSDGRAPHQPVRSRSYVRRGRGSRTALLMAEVHEHPAEVLRVLLDAVVHRLHVLLVEESQDVFLQRAGALARDDLDHGRLLRDRLVHDVAQCAIDVPAAVEDVVQIELELHAVEYPSLPAVGAIDGRPAGR